MGSIEYWRLKQMCVKVRRRTRVCTWQQLHHAELSLDSVEVEVSQTSSTQGQKVTTVYKSARQVLTRILMAHSASVVSMTEQQKSTNQWVTSTTMAASHWVQVF